MKGYAILLCILYFCWTGISLAGLVTDPQALLKLGHLARIAAFTACLAGAVELGFGKRFIKGLDTPDKWRLLSRGTLLLGGLTTMLYTHGESLGVPPMSNAGLLTMGMVFLPYLLFSIPVIVLEYDLRNKQA